MGIDESPPFRLGQRHGLLVRSLAVVLHRGADSPQLTGLYERGFPGEPADVTLRYRAVRVWQVPPQQWLSGGLGVVPLAPLGAVEEAELPAVIEQMKQRLDREVPRSQAPELWSATYILMGVRYEQALIQALFQGVLAMKESVTYQATLREGKAEGKAEGETEEARKILLLQGRSHFGEPPPEALAAVASLTDVQQLEELSVRLLQAGSWKELLGLDGPDRRGRGRRKTS